MQSDLYGPWQVEGYQVSVDFAEGVRLRVERYGSRLKGVPSALRQSGDFAWIRLTLDAAAQHRRQLRTLLEHAMVEEVPLSQEDLAMLALDPAGRCLLAALVVRVDSLAGLPLPDEWLMLTAAGDLAPLGAPACIPHPLALRASGELAAFDRWLGAQGLRQPFKQVRRETYWRSAEDLHHRTYTDRFAGDMLRWDQARAIFEGRGWHRITKTGAERHFRRARLTAHLEFRTPMSRGWSKEDVVAGRLYFLPIGDEVVNRASPGVPVEGVPPIAFSEAVRDVALACRVATL